MGEKYQLAVIYNMFVKLLPLDYYGKPRLPLGCKDMKE